MLPMLARCSSYLPTIPYPPLARSAVQATLRYSRLAGQVTLWSLNATFFFSKVFPAPTLAQNSLFLMNVAGLLSLPYTCDFAVKTYRDILFSWEAGNLTTTFTAVLKGLEILSNTGLQLTALAASFEQQSSLYSILIPWGETTLAFSVVLTAWYLHQNRKALHAENADPISILNSLQQKIPPTAFSALLHLLMDKDTLAEVKKNNPHPELYDEVIVKNLKTQYEIKGKGQMGLFILGYALRFLERFYPLNSTENATIGLGASTVWTGVTSVETYQEFKQRQFMERMESRTGNLAVYTAIQNEEL